MQNIIAGPNNQLITQSYQSPIQIPIPGSFIFVQTESERLALDDTNLEGMGVVQLFPSASLYTLHEGYWYLIAEGEGADPTYYSSDILNDSQISGSTVEGSLNFISSSLYQLQLTSQSLQRYNVDSGSFVTNINSLISTASLLTLNNLAFSTGTDLILSGSTLTVTLPTGSRHHKVIVNVTGSTTVRDITLSHTGIINGVSLDLYFTLPTSSGITVRTTGNSTLLDTFVTDSSGDPAKATYLMNTTWKYFGGSYPA